MSECLLKEKPFLSNPIETTNTEQYSDKGESHAALRSFVGAEPGVRSVYPNH